MKLVERFWASVIVVVNWLTLSPTDSLDSHQFPIANLVHGVPASIYHDIDPALEYEISTSGGGPKFRPPTGRPKRYGGDLKCEYPTLGTDWIPCSTAEDRRCWLKNTKTGQQYNITTDYEKLSGTPPGIMRNYTLVLSNQTVNADGIDFPLGKIFSEHFPNGAEFDGQFPGPWLQACWGDTLNVTVYNKLPLKNPDEGSNGTSIHWHGLRQWNSMPYDGVNGVSQCALAPDDNTTYIFRVMQYGSTWYHSHYSMQYADGTQGPLTLHGPTSFPFDEPKSPLIMTDWGHNSAFAAVYEKPDGPGLDRPSIVLNGAGNITRFSGGTIKNTNDIPPIYNITFTPGKRYLMRIINTSFHTGFRFSIDGHYFLIVETDLVPIEPIQRHSLFVHIGQRYNIIVQARDQDEIGDGNFWIRTYLCYTSSDINPGDPINYMKTGIVRYNDQNQDDPTDKTSIPWFVPPTCEDIAPGNLRPMLPWTIGRSFNDITNNSADFGAGYTPPPPTYQQAFFYWNVTDTAFKSAVPFQIQYNDSMLTKFGDLSKVRPEEVAVYGSEAFTADTWAYIVISGAGGHPIHLHGHDFAVVYVSNKDYEPGDITTTCPDNPAFSCDNPARRDVIMPPGGGRYVVIAFKTDNPGSWLMHCHIAAHAGAGLALQVLERPAEAASMWPPTNPAVIEANRVCKNWEAYWGKREQDDSGI